MTVEWTEFESRSQDTWVQIQHSKDNLQMEGVNGKITH